MNLVEASTAGDGELQRAEGREVTVVGEMAESGSLDETGADKVMSFDIDFVISPIWLRENELIQLNPNQVVGSSSTIPPNCNTDVANTITLNSDDGFNNVGLLLITEGPKPLAQSISEVGLSNKKKRKSEDSEKPVQPTKKAREDTGQALELSQKKVIKKNPKPGTRTPTVKSMARAQLE